MRVSGFWTRGGMGLLAVLACAVCVRAEEPPGLALSTLIRAALAANPEIQSARRAFEAAGERVRQAGGLDDPMIEYEYDTITDPAGMPMRTLAVSQDVPFPAKLVLRARMAARLAQMAHETWRVRERDVVSRVEGAYAELFLARKRIGANTEDRNVLDGMYRSATSRYGAGTGSQAEALKAQVELAKADKDRILLEARCVTAQARLNALLDRDPETPVPLPESVPAGTLRGAREDFRRRAVADNPELKALRQAIGRAEAALALARSGYLPDLKVRAGRLLDSGRDAADSWSLMVGVSVPLWFFARQAPNVREMKAELSAARADYRAKETAVLLDISDAYARAQANEKMIALYEATLIPQAREALNLALQGYEAGRGDFWGAMESRRVLLDFRIDHDKAVLDLALALADLERVSGDPETGKEETHP